MEVRRGQCQYSHFPSYMTRQDFLKIVGQFPSYMTRKYSILPIQFLYPQWFPSWFSMHKSYFMIAMYIFSRLRRLSFIFRAVKPLWSLWNPKIYDEEARTIVYDVFGILRRFWICFHRIWRHIRWKMTVWLRHFSVFTQFHYFPVPNTINLSLPVVISALADSKASKSK